LKQGSEGKLQGKKGICWEARRDRERKPKTTAASEKKGKKQERGGRTQKKGSLCAWGQCRTACFLKED